MDQPLDRRATLRRFALPALVCSAILAASYQRTAEGTRHPSPWGYRLWSFGALAYSDIIALHEDRGAKAHPFPYLHDKVEYPVLMGLGMWWPSALAPDRVGYFALTFAALALCALGVLWVLASLPQSQPWVWAASPALLVYTALNWDLFGILPLAAGLWLWAKLKDKSAVAVLTLAVWTKFFPLLVLGLVLVISLRHSCGLICVFSLANKVFSPQYWLWVVALVALAGLPGWLGSLVNLVALGDFVASFSRLHIQSERVWAITVWFDRFVFLPTVAA